PAFACSRSSFARCLTASRSAWLSPSAVVFCAIVHPPSRSRGPPCLMTTTLRSRACRCFSIPARLRRAVSRTVPGGGDRRACSAHDGDHPTPTCAGGPPGGGRGQPARVRGEDRRGLLRRRLARLRAVAVPASTGGRARARGRGAPPPRPLVAGRARAVLAGR